MPYQNISQEITQAQYDAFVVKLNELNALFTFFINLTEEERQSLSKMGNSKLRGCSQPHPRAGVLPRLRSSD